jgi:alpha-L-rhamnosidase
MKKHTDRVGLGGRGTRGGLTKLRCEYLTDPLGIEATRPRLSWVIASTRRGERPTAYQFLVVSSESLLKREKGDWWDIGKVSLDESVNWI